MSIPAHLLSNPLVNPPQLPHDALPLDIIEAKHHIPAIEWAIAKAQAEIDAIKNNPALPTFENTIEALEFSGVDLDRISGAISIFSNSKSSDAIRSNKKIIDPMVADHGSNIILDDVLFARVDAVYQSRAGLNLDAEQAMLLENAYKGFFRNGAALDPQGKQRLRDISQRLSILTQKFAENVVKSNEVYKKVIDQEADLDGVPDRIKGLLSAAADQEGLPGKWVIKLTRAREVMERATNRALREELYIASTSEAQSGPYDNRPIILEMVGLKNERANILGYPNHAEYVLSERMAGNAQTVNAFLQKNLDAYKPAAEKELKAVRDLAMKRDGLGHVQAWDAGYYFHLLKEQTLSYDEEELRPYLKLENVRDGLFRHAEKLFDITITDAGSKYPVYDADVMVYEVFDNASGDQIGVFYADYYEREGAKNDGAWMQGIRTRGLYNGKDMIPLVFNNCNYPKPTATTPTLLSMRDVETMFHEFGHALHALLSKGRFASLTGTKVKRDWVELPSQIMENWAREKSVLDTFAIHWQTGQTVPADLIWKMSDASKFGVGSAGLRQTHFGLLDMKWHTTDPSKITAVEDLENQVKMMTSLLPHAGGCQSPTFGHLFAGGYSAGYYGYKWAEALDADVFSVFQKQGLYDRALADRLRKTIYEPGGTRPPMDLFHAMMGRAPDPDALFRREGLLLLPPPASPQALPPTPKP